LVVVLEVGLKALGLFGERVEVAAVLVTLTPFA
jgi:hypothetical protein